MDAPNALPLVISRPSNVSIPLRFFCLRVCLRSTIVPSNSRFLLLIPGFGRVRGVSPSRMAGGAGVGIWGTGHKSLFLDGWGNGDELMRIKMCLIRVFRVIVHCVHLGEVLR